MKKGSTTILYDIVNSIRRALNKFKSKDPERLTGEDLIECGAGPVIPTEFMERAIDEAYKYKVPLDYYLERILGLGENTRREILQYARRAKTMAERIKMVDMDKKLAEDHLTLEQEFPQDTATKEKIKRIWIPQVITICMLLWALNPKNPYDYYIVLRFVCCGVFAYLAYQAYNRENDRWTWVLGITAIVYNPFFRVHLTREFWSFINIITIIIALVSIFFLRKSKIN